MVTQVKFINSNPVSGIAEFLRSPALMDPRFAFPRA